MDADDIIDAISDALDGATPWTRGSRTGRRRAAGLSAWDAEGIRLARIEARYTRRARRRSGRRRWLAPWTRWPVVHPTQAETEYRNRLAELVKETEQPLNRNQHG